MSSSKIKDLVDVVPVESRADSNRGRSPEALATFLMSYEIGDAVARTVGRLSSSDDGPHNCLVVGGPGCGKSRLLEAVSALLEADPSANMHSRLAEVRASFGDHQMLVARVTDPTDEPRLAAVLERTAIDRLATAGIRRPRAGEPGTKLDLLAQMAEELPQSQRLVFVLDNLDRWLDASAKYALENAQTLVRLGELSRTMPLAVCAAAGEYVLTHDSGSGGQGWIAALLDTYRIEYIPGRALRSATASNVLVKNARQRKEIGEVLDLLREKLPDLECSEEEFVELFPLEVSTWAVGSHLHRWLDGFSFPDFAARAAESVKRRPAPSLFALNDMFTLYEPKLRHVEALEPSFATYDRLVAEALPRLGSQQRLWGRLALQSIFMHTLAGIAADVTTITNSVLLYDLHGGGSSYTMMSAVLKQLETLDRGQLVASGEGLGRRYSLVTGEREALLVLVADLADAIESDEEASSSLLGVGGHVFADWPFGASGPERGRIDLWEIEQNAAHVAIEARTLQDTDTGDLMGRLRPRLVIFSPGRPWSEANEEARRRPITACWTGAMPTPPELQTMRKWLAASRLATSDRGKRFSDLPALLDELEAQAIEIFRRVYVDGGTLVTSGRSDGIADLVGASREENLVVRLLPAQDGTAAAQRAADGLNGEAEWVARLLAETEESVDEVSVRLDAEGWLPALEAWYRARVGRDDTAPMRMLGERGVQIAEVVDGLDAKQLFDVALYYVRRALASGTARGLGVAIAKVFETPERFWESRRQLTWLEQFADWMPTLESASEYVRGAEPIEDQEVESLRESLLGWTERLDDFVDPRRRQAFARTFDAFRDEYARCYVKLHDEALGAATIDRLCGEIVASQSWQALETFSTLSIGDPGDLVDAINLVSAVRDAQCTADVAAVLREAATCTCGFRFAESNRTAEMADRVRELLEAGIARHRRLLQARRAELRDKIMACKASYDIETIRAIAEITREDGDLPPVTARTIEVINELLANGDSWVGSGNGDGDQPIASTKGL